MRARMLVAVAAIWSGVVDVARANFIEGHVGERTFRGTWPRSPPCPIPGRSCSAAVCSASKAGRSPRRQEGASVYLFSTNGDPTVSLSAGLPYYVIIPDGFTGTDVLHVDDTFTVSDGTSSRAFVQPITLTRSRPPASTWRRRAR